MSSHVSKSRSRRRLIDLGGVLRNAGGAIDLASVMVGVIVIGIIGTVIASTVFAVIPWAQNEAAKASLASAQTAEAVAYVKGTSDTESGYVAYNALVSNKLMQADPAMSIAVDAGGNCYVAAVKSVSGEIYLTESGSPTVVKWTPATTTTCSALADALAGLPT